MQRKLSTGVRMLSGRNDTKVKPQRSNCKCIIDSDEVIDGPEISVLMLLSPRQSTIQ